MLARRTPVNGLAFFIKQVRPTITQDAPRGGTFLPDKSSRLTASCISFKPPLATNLIGRDRPATCDRGQRFRQWCLLSVRLLRNCRPAQFAWNSSQLDPYVWSGRAVQEVSLIWYVPAGELTRTERVRFLSNALPQQDVNADGAMEANDRRFERSWVKVLAAGRPWASSVTLSARVVI
jgi:hypothetical protein